MSNITGPIEEVIKYYDFRCRKGYWALSFPDSVTKMLSDALDGRITEGVLPGR